MAARSRSFPACGRRSHARPDAAGDKDVHVMGGADVIRQALEAGLVDELSIIVAPVVLGGGKRLFDGFATSLELEHLGVTQSPFATFIDYRVKR
jgi:dihydrofolate reductase